MAYKKCNYSARDLFAQTPREAFSVIWLRYTMITEPTNTPSINLSSASDPSTITVNELPDTAIKLHLDWGIQRRYNI